MEEDTTGFMPYARGGIVTQHKEQQTLTFKTLAQALQEPGEFLLSDFAKMERPALLHIAFQALDAFQVCPDTSLKAGIGSACSKGMI